jgi:hypothetical protein
MGKGKKRKKRLRAAASSPAAGGSASAEGQEGLVPSAEVQGEVRSRINAALQVLFKDGQIHVFDSNDNHLHSKDISPNTTAQELIDITEGVRMAYLSQ